MERIQRTYYELLGLTPSASLEEIKEAYREIARIYHPDSQFYSDIVEDIDLPESDSDVFKEITAAYTVLTNEEKRNEYDATLPKNLGDDEQETGGVSFHDIPEEWKKEREFFEQNYFEILKPGPKVSLTGENVEPKSHEEGAGVHLDGWDDQPPAVETVFGDLSSTLSDKLDVDLPLARRPASRFDLGFSADPFNLMIYLGIPLLTLLVLIECYFFL